MSDIDTELRAIARRSNLSYDTCEIIEQAANKLQSANELLLKAYPKLSIIWHVISYLSMCGIATNTDKVWEIDQLLHDIDKQLGRDG